MKLNDSSYNQGYLIIPIETKVREFHAKLLLSCFAAIEGYNVILGDQNDIQRYLRYLPRGIYIDKSITGVKAKSFRRNIGMGNKVVAWCEEGLAFRHKDAYLREQIDLESFKLVDLFLAWGKFHDRTVKEKLRQNQDKIVAAGNPRFDLLRDPYRSIFFEKAKAIRSQYGPFILINTNFTRYNHYYGRDYVIKTSKEKGRIQNQTEELFFIQWADYLKDMYYQFLIMIAKLSERCADRTIIIRPHPSESINKWADDTKKFKNVKVIHEGNVAPWIMASEIMIHNSCTTGLEAFILDEPVICYCPITSEIFDAVLPNLVGEKISNIAELIQTIYNLRQFRPYPSGNKENRERQFHLIADYIEGIQGPTACKNILAALRSLKQEQPRNGNRRLSLYLNYVALKTNDLFFYFKPFARRILKGKAGIDGYLKQKFPGLEIHEVREVLEQFKKIENKFQHVNALPYPGTKSCFLITRGA